MIRAAQDPDIERIARLTEQLGYAGDITATARRLGEIRSRGAGQVYVAESDNQVVGWIHVLGVYVVETPAHALVAGLVVEYGFRGRGIGGELMAAAEAWAAANGFDTIRVGTNVMRDAAHEFYRHMGYRELKRQTVFCRDLQRDRIPPPTPGR